MVTRQVLIAGLLSLVLVASCGGSSSGPTLKFQSPSDGDVFCAKDDVDLSTADLDIGVVVKATGLAEGVKVVLENDTTGSATTQPIVGGVATFTVVLAAGSNRLVAHTSDNRAVALPPITVTSNVDQPVVTITRPLDATILGAAEDVDHDLGNGFQYDVEVRAEVEDGLEADLYVGGVLQAPATVSNKRAVFSAVTLPSGSVTLEAKVRNACGNEGTDTATVTVQTGQPGCSIQGFSPTAAVIPSPGPGTVLNISTDGDTGSPGMQTDLLVQVTPEGGALAGLTVEVFYGSGATAKATGTTDAAGLATIALSPPEGDLVISARCWDDAGNAGVSQDQAVLVDTVAPDCALDLAGVGGPKASGLFNPEDDVDTGTGGVQIAATVTSTASDVVGLPADFSVNGTPAGDSPTIGSGRTASKDVTLAAGSQPVSVTIADRAQNSCTAERTAVLDEAGCVVSFTNLTAGTVLNIASDSAAATGLQYGVNLDVDAECAGQTLTLTSSKGGSVQQTIPAGSGTIAMTFADYTVCSGSCQQQVTLTATVEDPAGNVTTKQVTFFADNVPPAANVSITNPAGAQCGGVITPAQDVDGNASNGVQVDVLVVTALDRASLGVDVTNGGGTSTFTPSPATSNTVRVTLAGGSNSIVANVISATGNPGTTSPACTLSLQDLAVVFTSPVNAAKLGRSAGTVNGNDLVVDVTGTVSAAGATVTLQVDSGTPVSANVVGTTWTVTGVTLSQTTHTLRVDASASGGRTGTASISVQVDISPPTTIPGLTITPINRARVRLDFTAPSDPAGGTGIQSYRIRYSSAAITDANFATATPITPTPPTPAAPGTAEQIPANSLRVGPPYYFAVAAVDQAGNQALIASAGPVTLSFTTTGYGAPSIGNLAAAARFGQALAVGNLNGDAYPDLVVGMPFASFASTGSSEGAVLVYLGTATGFHASPDFVLRAAAGSWLGNSVAVLDFDGDMTQDLAIGAPGANGFGGAVYLCRGGTRFAQPASPPTLIDPSTCELTITHSNPAGNGFGWSVAGGNFDGDDADDLVVGAPGSAGLVGEAFVLYGAKPMPGVTAFELPDGATAPSPVYRAWQLVNSGANAQWGTFVYGLGKLEGNGDATDEIGVAGATQDRAYVYYGRAAPTTNEIVIPANGTGVVALAGPAGSEVGTGMAGIGDTDGDGRREVAVGAPGAGAGGVVYLVNGTSHDAGNPNLLTLATASAGAVPTVISGVGGERFGTFIANPAAVNRSGDLNGDGAVDLWVANWGTPWRGYLFYGGATGLGASLTSGAATWYFSPAGGDSAYGALAITPDLNGDSLPDLVAADWYSTAQTVTVLK